MSCDDDGFVAFFLQVNSDVTFHKRDRYGTLTPYRVDKLHVGKLIYTKAVGSTGPEDVTHTYKYPEGLTHTHTLRMTWTGASSRTELVCGYRDPAGPSHDGSGGGIRL